MQSSCTYTHTLEGVYPVLSGEDCSYTGTTTIAIAGPVVAYDPFIDASLGIGLWVLIVIAVVAMILKFR